MEIKNNMFVRMKSGEIIKVRLYFPSDNPLWEVINGQVILRSNIINSSYDITDLLENRDIYFHVTKHESDCGDYITYDYDCFYEEDREFVRDIFKSGRLKSVLSKEVFNKYAYNIEEKEV